MSIHTEQNSEPVAYKCMRCGMESQIKEAFLIKKSLFGSQKAVCFECDLKETVRLLGLESLFLLALVALAYRLNPNAWPTQVLAGGCLVLLSAIPVSLLHELAHASVGRLAGLEIFALHLGVGPVVFQTEALGVRWVLNRVPVGGVTMMAAPEVRFYRLRTFLAILAGPSVHALTVLALLPFLRPGIPLLWETFLYGSIAFNAFMFLANLFPTGMAGNQGIMKTDGWHLLNLPRLAGKELQECYALYYGMQALQAYDVRHDTRAASEWIERGLGRYADNPQLLNIAGVIYNYTNEIGKARGMYLRVLETEGIPAGLRYLAMNNVAYANLMLEDPALLAQADEYSAEAYKNFSWQPSVIGTRGRVLAELGQVEAGLALLKSALAKSTDKRSKAMNACDIARVEIMRGERTAAQTYLHAARQLDPHCPLLPDVTRRYAAMENG